MNIEMNVVTLEDNKDYYEIAKINLNDKTYLVFSAKDEDNMVFRKLVESSVFGKLTLEKLDDVEEFRLVVDEFMKKFQ